MCKIALQELMEKQATISAQSVMIGVRHVSTLGHNLAILVEKITLPNTI